MFYQTRQMVAKRQMPHGGDLIEVGGAFACSHVDAEYYTHKGWAAESEPQNPGHAAAVIASPVAPSATPKRRGRPPKIAIAATTAAPPQDPQTESAVAAPDAVETDTVE
jgi:hypothetical protein